MLNENFAVEGVKSEMYLYPEALEVTTKSIFENAPLKTSDTDNSVLSNSAS